jgi:hypothetical protein
MLETVFPFLYLHLVPFIAHRSSVVDPKLFFGIRIRLRISSEFWLRIWILLDFQKDPDPVQTLNSYTYSIPIIFKSLH